MEGKKISFAFTKTRRALDTRLAAPVQPRADDERRELIECIEEKSIKVIGGEEVVEKKPLVIPLKPNTLATAERLQQIAAEVEESLKEEPETLEKCPDDAPAPPPDETLEQQAARELLQEARRERRVEPSTLTVPVSALPPLLGEKESTLEDYESVPITDFGLAMLRGMGWKPGKERKHAQPTLRPKGLGLGADKLVKVEDKKGGGKGEELKMQKGSLVRVVAGKHAGVYGKVVSMDEESGRVLVDPAVRAPSVSVSEHTLQLLTRQEYDKNCRVINSEKYEEYKMKEKLENNEKSGSSKSTSKHSEPPKQRDNLNGSSRSSRRNSSSEEMRMDSKKEGNQSGQRSRRHSSSSENEKDDRTSRDVRSQHQAPKNSSRGRSETKSGKTQVESHKHRSTSSGDDDRDKRDSRKESGSRSDRNARNLPSSSEGRPEQISRNNDKMKSDRRERRDSSSSSEDSRTRRKHKSKNKPRERSSGSESLNSLSSDEPKRSKKSKKNKERGITPVGKRDIDKKRKGKKKKRDRDRSPNYRKHKR